MRTPRNCNTIQCLNYRDIVSYCADDVNGDAILRAIAEYDALGQAAP
jgi:hypothetical protein